MGMNVGSGSGEREPEVMVDINTTPLIDVMLVLLIMFIITIPIQTHAVKMNMPVPSNAAPPPKPPEIIPDRATLESRLAEVARTPDQPEVHLRPNKLVTYKHVAMIMASAQRLGVTKIGIVGNEQFLN